MEALQGRLHPAKEKITKEEVQEKTTELHRKQRKGKKRRAGQVFQAINSEGGVLESKPSEIAMGRKGGGRQGGASRGPQMEASSSLQGRQGLHKSLEVREGRILEPVFDERMIRFRVPR